MAKVKQDIVDQLDRELFLDLLRREEYELLYELYNSLLYSTYRCGHILNEGQIDVLQLPVELWGQKAGVILVEMGNDN